MDEPISRRGMQIVYVPDHAQGDVDHPSCEQGFTWSFGVPDKVFCRFFSKNHRDILRTRSNSELVPVKNLVLRKHRHQRVIDSWVKLLEEENPPFYSGNS